LNFEEQREAYSRTIVDLSEDRWIFLNTLFSLSEGCLYAQVVDLLDRKEIPEILGYRELYRALKAEVDGAHAEGRLKAEIIADPERFVILDPETSLAVLDQHHAGKKLLLITNSEWTYTSAMMSYSFDRFLPTGMSWRELFDVIIVGARKPEFFTTRSPLFEVATEDGLLRPVTRSMAEGHAYLGGSARDVESHLKLSGDEILYVGDHMFGDVKVTKSVLRWRTALVLRELEDEIGAISEFQDSERKLSELMDKKETLEGELCQVRLALQRLRQGYGPPGATSHASEAELQKRAEELRSSHAKLDEQVGPLAKASAELANPIWGLLMRAGNDKSHLARQVERYADIYTSRVANLLTATPFVYFRSTRGSLPHDPGGNESFSLR
ncbi:MAG TPA: 5'-nucleotidase domain-containing protein, partial [Bdellovibrionota bacterium]|nr:5'-nucleotidase domain-containing protein [Bdellovibrionota bacterium]